MSYFKVKVISRRGGGEIDSGVYSFDKLSFFFFHSLAVAFETAVMQGLTFGNTHNGLLVSKQNSRSGGDMEGFFYAARVSSTP